MRIERMAQILGAFGLGLMGCSSDEGAAPDTGARDASALDARAPDARDADVVGNDGMGPPASAYESAPQNLTEWNLFVDAREHSPGPRTVPYTVISPLFSDYAAKRRFVFLPEGKQIGYEPENMWRFPVGSVLVKTFSYPFDMRAPEKGERLLETRLLVFTEAGLKPHTYVWNEDQTEAIRKVSGTAFATSWLNEVGEAVANRYSVPNTNQCYECHGEGKEADALGLRTRQLDLGEGSENQVDRFAALGLLDRTPEPRAERERLVDPFSAAASISERARSYLDANCAQCHKQGGDASASGMWLDWPHTAPDQDPSVWGVCKRPTSAGGATCGLEVDIVPGQPEASIYMCRVESHEAKVKMPPLGRNMVHTEGVQLLADWIRSLEGSCK